MRVAWLVALAGCGTDTPPPTGEPERERDVIVDVPRGAGTVIYQDGDGPWRVAPQLADRHYGFDVEDPRYAVAITCADELAQEVEVVFATVGEQRDVVLAPICGGAVQTPEHAITGSIRNLPAGRYRVAAGTSEVDGDSAFETYRVDTTAGPQTVLFALTPLEDLTRFAIRRGLAVGGDHTLDIDFVNAAPAATVFVPGNLAFTQAAFVTGDRSVLRLDALDSAIAYPPPELWRAGDHLVISSTWFSGARTDRVTIESFDSGSPPDAFVFVPGDLFFGEVFEDAAGQLRAAWGELLNAEHYGAQLFVDFPIADPACGTLGCLPRWTVRVTPGRRGTEGLRIVPTEAELRELGAWDARLSFRERTVVWTAGGTTIERDRLGVVTRTIESSFQGSLGGDLEK